MARPRGDADGPSAQKRLEDAFWAQLAAMPLSQMTVKGISSAAGVNHNTFYRHFGSLGQMAEALVDSLVVDELPALLLGAATPEERGRAMLRGMGKGEARRAVLVAKCGNEALVRRLRRRIMGTWLRSAGVCWDDLSPEQRLDLSIVFGGLVCAMGELEGEPDPAALVSIAQRPLGQGIFATLAALAPEG